MSYTKLDIKELQNRLDAIAISEDADMTTHEARKYKPRKHSIKTDLGELFDNDSFNIAHAIVQLAQKLVAGPKPDHVGKDYDMASAEHEASQYYTGEDMRDDSSEYVIRALDAYERLSDSDREKFMKNYVEPPVVDKDALYRKPFYAPGKQPRPDGGFYDESVQEGEAELAELKSALGRTGGVMGFKN